MVSKNKKKSQIYSKSFEAIKSKRHATRFLCQSRQRGNLHDHPDSTYKGHNRLPFPLLIAFSTTTPSCSSSACLTATSSNSLWIDCAMRKRLDSRCFMALRILACSRRFSLSSGISVFRLPCNNRKCHTSYIYVKNKYLGDQTTAHKRRLLLTKNTKDRKKTQGQVISQLTFPNRLAFAR